MAPSKPWGVGASLSSALRGTPAVHSRLAHRAQHRHACDGGDGRLDGGVLAFCVGRLVPVSSLMQVAGSECRITEKTLVSQLIEPNPEESLAVGDALHCGDVMWSASGSLKEVSLDKPAVCFLL